MTIIYQRSLEFFMTGKATTMNSSITPIPLQWCPGVLDDGKCKTHCKEFHLWSNANRARNSCDKFHFPAQGKQNNIFNKSISNKKMQKWAVYIIAWLWCLDLVEKKLWHSLIHSFSHSLIHSMLYIISFQSWSYSTPAIMALKERTP